MSTLQLRVTQKEVSIAFQILLKYGEVISSIVKDKQQFEVQGLFLSQEYFKRRC